MESKTEENCIQRSIFIESTLTIFYAIYEWYVQCIPYKCIILYIYTSILYYI